MNTHSYPHIQTTNASDLRVAIVHYWLVGMRGGEKVLETLCRMFPQAVIFTHVYAPDQMSDLINSHEVRTTKISNLPMARSMYQKYLPLMPNALAKLDLTDFDLIISSESGPAKGVKTRADAVHLCYCHSPMRYIWDQYDVYRQQAGLITRTVMPALVGKLRSWDQQSASALDGIASNSNHVANRVKTYWDCPSHVVHPPVAVEDFSPVPASELGEFYLWAGELAPYKRPDLAVEAFNRLKKPLIVIGGPPKTERTLSRLANPEYVHFLGRVSFDKMKAYMAHCRALIFPGEEDFGIVPVEVMASGRPVIAYGKGGALDTVVDGKTGLLFQDQTVEGLIQAVTDFEAQGLDKLPAHSIVKHAQKFSEKVFVERFLAFARDHGLDIALTEE
ncbi:glycosyltransferase [Shimia abyssi]|uniref:Glycosyltransferase involved in cell wall biosynthesis n=1 Tax=Shimia abyssi TaxID=1662395 RepID=A0A2P8F9R3_9RHOB|nr:glycosyltransferase [Shimia abyssi]PSL18466.1 glycosyltransferase involved in cell wall biosynthesis [Shimia abyssi]